MRIATASAVSLKEAVLSHTKYEFHTWLLSELGDSALNHVIAAAFERWVRTGSLARFVNLVIMLDVLQHNDLLTDPPEGIMLAPDESEWGKFENKYYGYYVQYDNMLV